MARDGSQKKSQPGFQGSETSGVEIVVYPHGDDPVVASRGDPQGRGPIQFTGRARDVGEGVSLSRFSTSWVLGSPGPTFTVEYKDPDDKFPLRTFFMDDDWVDVSLVRHGQRRHYARGILDSPPGRLDDVGGATRRTYRLSGRGFGGVWERTPVYFNAAIGEIAELNAFQALADANAFGDGSPSTVVDAILFRFFALLEDSTVGVVWEFPPGIPNVREGTFFREQVSLLTEAPADSPRRVAALPGLYPDFEGNTLWDLGQEWSDPQFNELIPVLVDRGSGRRPGPDDAFTPDQTEMRLLFRRRPFPWEGDLDTWFGLETVDVTRQDVVRAEIQPNGSERYNSFVVKTKGYASFLGVLQQVLTSQVNQADVRRHGLRRFESTSQYVGLGEGEDNLLGVLDEQRSMLRDWFGLNPYFWSGTLELARGFPEIEPGYRLRLAGETEDERITFYVEGVSHDWSLRRGLRTTVTVSRGWQGTDQSYRRVLAENRANYAAATALGGNG